MINSKQPSSGFTLIELIIALGVFGVVITTAVGALLMLVATNEQLQQEQNVMSNLSFALDSMTREIRTGTDYQCVKAANSQSTNGRVFAGKADLNDPSNLDDPHWNDCPSGNVDTDTRFRGIVFTEAGNSITQDGGKILYFFDRDGDDAADISPGLYRRIGDEPSVKITAPEIFVHDAVFYVNGVDQWRSDDDTVQPSVSIVLKVSGDENTPEDEWDVVQTTVSQRTLDL